MPPMLSRSLVGGVVVAAAISVASLDHLFDFLLNAGVEEVLAVTEVLFKSPDESPPTASFVVLVSPDTIDVIVRPHQG